MVKPNMTEIIKFSEIFTNDILLYSEMDPTKLSSKKYHQGSDGIRFRNTEETLERPRGTL